MLREEKEKKKEEKKREEKKNSTALESLFSSFSASTRHMRSQIQNSSSFFAIQISSQWSQ